MSRSSAHPGSKALQVSAPPSQSVGLSTDVHNSVDIALSTTDPSCPSGRFRSAMPPCLSVTPALTTLPASPAQRLSHSFTGNDDAHQGAEASLSRAPAGTPLSGATLLTNHCRHVKFHDKPVCSLSSVSLRA